MHAHATCPDLETLWRRKESTRVQQLQHYKALGLPHGILIRANPIFRLWKRKRNREKKKKRKKSLPTPGQAICGRQQTFCAAVFGTVPAGISNCAGWNFKLCSKCHRLLRLPVLLVLTDVDISRPLRSRESSSFFIRPGLILHPFRFFSFSFCCCCCLVE